MIIRVQKNLYVRLLYIFFVHTVAYFTNYNYFCRHYMKNKNKKRI